LISSAFKAFVFVLSRAWREKRNAEVRGEDGWLAVVSLSWLKEGSNSFGAGKNMNIVFDLPREVGLNKVWKLEYK